jgi:hypothetical protein
MNSNHCYKNSKALIIINSKHSVMAIMGPILSNQISHGSDQESAQADFVIRDNFLHIN